MKKPTETQETISRATRTPEQVLAQQTADAERDRANSTPTPTHAVVPANGFDEPASSGHIMQGTHAKFVDGRWSESGGGTLPSPLLAFGTTTCLQMWKNKQATTIPKEAGKDLPDPAELNSKIPESEWEKGLDGKPTPPWKKNWICYLCDPRTGGIFTTINSTYGQKKAVETLESQVRTMRTLRAAAAVPVVELASKPMVTEFGQKMRPHFEITGWRSLGGGAAPQLEHKNAMPGTPVEPVTLKEELNDSVNF
jgi:hypothetical protein